MKAVPIANLLLISMLILSLFAFNVPWAWASYDWEITRPDHLVEYNDHISNADTDGKASVGVGLHISRYYENNIDAPYNGNDGITMKAIASANTRRIIEYSVSGDSYFWHTESELTWNLYLGDDTVEEIGLSDKYRFYGGVGSAEYNSIWVSSNGVLFFNETSTAPSYSSSIPDRAYPDNFIAPFWRDLKPNQGGTIKYGYVQHPPSGKDCLIISWYNVPDLNGNPQSFQVIIEPASMYFGDDPDNYQQSRIWFQYDSITIDVPTTVGLEDQLGERGVSYNYLSLGSGTALLFSQNSHYAVITNLGIEIIENDGNADINIEEDHDQGGSKGKNVVIHPSDPGGGDPNAIYWKALAGTAALLLSLSGNPAIVFGGFIIGKTLFAVSMAETLAVAGSRANVYVEDNPPEGEPDFASVQCYESTYHAFPVDAWFGIQFYWIFTDPNNAPHVLTVRTSVGYNEYAKYGGLVGSGIVTTSTSLHVTVSSGGCPFVSAWNGTQYVVDNNILRDNARGSGTEVEDYYRLEQDLVPLYEGSFYSYYSLQVSEFQQEHSYLDEVDLFAVDHEANISVTVSPTGEILTYQNPYVPIYAVDENDTSWLDEISNIGGNYYESYRGSFLVLNFGEVNSSIAKLIIRADPPPGGYPPTKKSIHIQALNSSENWVEAVSIIPRTYWSTEIIDLSDYLPSEGELVVRLYFTDNHRVDFVGLDTTPQAAINVEDTYLLLAYHSDEGFVTAELCSDDDVYAELVPNQQITLLFSAAKPDAEVRTFIFYVKGYYTITG